MTAFTGFRLLTPPILSRSAVLRDERVQEDDGEPFDVIKLRSMRTDAELAEFALAAQQQQSTQVNPNAPNPPASPSQATRMNRRRAAMAVACVVRFRLRSMS